jgi:hypothetical protein
MWIGMVIVGGVRLAGGDDLDAFARFDDRSAESRVSHELADPRLEPEPVEDDEVGIRQLANLGGLGLEVVQVSARPGEAHDLDGIAADFLHEVGEDHVGSYHRDRPRGRADRRSETGKEND